MAGLLTLSRNLGQLTGRRGWGLFAVLAGGPDLALATADELAFATRVTFAPTALLLMSAWLAGRGSVPCRGDVARDGCESGER